MPVSVKSLQRFTARRVNKALRKVGLQLAYLERDFESFPVDAFTRRKLFEALAIQYQIWVDRQVLFEVSKSFDAVAATEDFFNAWSATPFREQQGGSRFNNLLWLFLISKSYAPALIVDSGTYSGASAWALSMGSPNAEVYSFDIDLSQLKLRSPSVKYFESDWAEGVSLPKPKGRFLAYFDDHVEQIKRLNEAHERRCDLAIFDDDYPLTSFYSMAPRPCVLPKIELALDNDLQDGQVIEWIYKGQQHRWVVDRNYIESGLSKIAATERLPNTSLVTGIHQTPYRLVALR